MWEVVTENPEFYDLIRLNVDGMIIVDSAGTVCFANPAAQAMLGREIVGAPFGAPSLDDRAHLTLRTPDGHAAEVEMRVGPIDWQGERASLVSLRDITQRWHHDVQLHRSQKMEALGQFAGGVAHDFNNLLTIITGYTDSMLRRLRRLRPMIDAGSPSAREVAELFDEAQEVHRASDSAYTVTRQLLGFARKHVLRPEPLDFNGLLREVEPTLHDLLGERCRLRLDLDPAGAYLEGEAGKLRQVVINLTANACEAMPDGGELRISTATIGHASDGDGKLPAGRIRITFADTGRGMPAEVAERVFEPFFSTKSPDHGSGLGLSTVFAILRQHQGTIDVVSTPGVGTRFVIDLPACRPRARCLGKVEPPPGVGVSHSGVGVLVVEDQVRIRRLVTRVLREEGYHVLEAEDPNDALHKLDQAGDDVHVLLTDVVMPEMTGPELAEVATRRRPDVRVLFMSGYTNGYLSDAADHLRATVPNERFLQKPFSVDQLLDRVGELVTDLQPARVGEAGAAGTTVGTVKVIAGVDGDE